MIINLVLSIKGINVIVCLVNCYVAFKPTAKKIEKRTI